MTVYVEIFSIIFAFIFASGWTGTVLWGIYSTGLSIDASLHSLPTNCTILSIRWMDGNFMVLNVNFTTPGNATYTCSLDSVDQGAVYNVNQTIPCYYSVHHPGYATAVSGHVDGGTIAGMVISCLFAIPVVIVAVILIALIGRVAAALIYRAFKACAAVWGRIKNGVRDMFNRRAKDPNELGTPNPRVSIWESLSKHILVPVNYCNRAFGNTLSRIKNTFKRTKKDNAYALEDQNSQLSRATSGNSFASTKKLVSSRNYQERETEDQISTETRSL